MKKSLSSPTPAKPDPREALERLGSFAHYADPTYYTHTYAARDSDVRYYVDVAKKAKGPVLELGAGNGRITVPLARNGIRVTAVDHSRPMLQDLRARLADEPASLVGSPRDERPRHADARRSRRLQRNEQARFHHYKSRNLLAPKRIDIKT